MRIEQEAMVIRYVLFCRPSLRTIMALALRLSIVGVACLVFASIQLSSHFLQSPLLNIAALVVFLLVVSSFLWEFGYTIQHVKRYGSFLAILMLLPLPLYVAIYAQSEVPGSEPSKLKLSGYSFNATSTQAPSQEGDVTKEGAPKHTNEWYRLNYAKVGGLSFSYKQQGIHTQTTEEDDSLTEPAVTERPLAYPNPFRPVDGTLLGYGLSKSLDVEVNIYNMFGNLIEKLTITAGEEGGKKGYNRLKFSGRDASGTPLSAGAYFFFILHDGKVLSKGKMAVLP